MLHTRIWTLRLCWRLIFVPTGSVAVFLVPLFLAHPVADGVIARRQVFHLCVLFARRRVAPKRCRTHCVLLELKEE